jgi:hypothetical protein
MEDIQIQKKKNVYEEIDKLTPDPHNFWQIDLLKTLMIALVIMDHSIPHNILRIFDSLAWERIAIPVLMVIMGFNWGKSLARNPDQSLKSLYSWKGYFKPKIQRFLVPFAIIYGLSLIYLLLANVFIGPNFLLNVYPINEIPDLHEPFLKLFLILPVYGPGNWFIPMLFGMILLFPLIYRLFTWKPWAPWIMLVVYYAIEAAFQYWIFLFVNSSYATQGFVDWRINIFTFCPLMLLSAVALGLWLSIDHRWDAPRNIIIWLLGIASLVFVIYDLIAGYPSWARMFGIFDYNLWIYPYSALIVFLSLNIFPKSPSGPQFRAITTVSKSTYHILMTQIFYFSVIYGLLLPLDAAFGTVPRNATVALLNLQHANYLWFYPLNLVITFTIGILWYKAGKQFWSKRNSLNKKVSERQLKMMKAKGWIK